MTIIASIITCFLLSKLVTAQLNGDFWWLNEKLGKYVEERLPPKFEDLTEFDTDDSARIIFRDNDLTRSIIKLDNSGLKNVYDDSKIYFRDQSSLVWPTNYKPEPLISKPVNVDKPLDISDKKTYKNKEKSDDDILEFKFPEDDNLIWNDEKEKISKSTTTEKPKLNKNKTDTYKLVLVNSKVPIKVLDNFTPESENICTYLKNTDCNQRGGVVYIRRGAKKYVFGSVLVCCILPLSNDTNKITFLDQPIIKRYKRSNKDLRINAALAQRQALLLRKYSTAGQQVQKTRLPPVIQANLGHKIVTPGDDYVDPYWNIKNSNFNKENTKITTIQQTQNKQDYVPDDYVEDYTVELPKPGLVGLYSDHSGSPGWTFGNGNKQPAYGGGSDDDVGEEQPSFGYGAMVDPRLEDRLLGITFKPQFLGRPNKVSTQTTSDEYVYDTESQTINYQSNPDFQVLQGFKLLNLVHNKSKIHKNGKKTTVLNDSKESVLVDTSDNTDYDVFDTNQQVYKECGRTLIKDDDVKEKNMGETEQGSHPWLALVVLTRQRQTILCYATLVHSRAAVTSADCVHGRACPGEVTLIAGAWDLKDESHENWQKRMISVHIHDQYTPGELANNLAVLHWTRPLKLNLNVQPACMTDPHVGDNCKFYGWGGYDQAIRAYSRWQRASILTPRICNDRLSSKKEIIPNNAFCASVHSRGTVTGIGAPLVCNIGGRHAAAGIAIWRDNVVVLAPVHDWTMRVLEDLNLQ